MKKKLLTIISIIAILATMFCMASTITMAEVSYGEPLLFDFSDPIWFDTEKAAWAEHIKEQGDNKILSLADSKGINGMGNWDRISYGQEFVQTPTEQYLRLYDQPSTYAHYDATTNHSLFYFFTEAVSQAAGLSDPLKVTFKVRKVGAGWENATISSGWGDDSGYFLRFYGWNPVANDWLMQTDYDDQLAAANVNEWVYITKEVVVPSSMADCESLQLQFFYGNHTDLELHIACAYLYVPIDTTNLPEIDPTTATFDGNNPEDVTVSINLKDFSLSPIKLNDVAITRSDYSLSNDKTSLTFKKEFLATLENGEHEFLISTPGGQCSLIITVSNANPNANNNNNQGNTGNDAPATGGCGSIITATSAVLASTLLMGALFVFKKKY